jgi:hypothetical protein
MVASPPLAVEHHHILEKGGEQHQHHDFMDGTIVSSTILQEWGIFDTSPGLYYIIPMYDIVHQLLANLLGGTH